MTTSVPSILADLKKANGQIFSYSVEGTKHAFAGYNVSKVEEIWAFIKGEGYFDALDYTKYRGDFTRAVNGQPLQMIPERQASARATIEKMDADTLARFAFFVQKEEKFRPGYMAERIQDGTFGAIISRIGQLGPRVAAPVAAVA